MTAEHPKLLRVVLRVLQVSMFLAALSLLGGLGVGWITSRLVFGATFVTLCFFSVLMGFVPFRVGIHDFLASTPQVRAVVLVETSILVAAVYFVSMVAMRKMDNVGFMWLSNPRQPYILAPACFYGIVLIVMAMTVTMSDKKQDGG